MSRSDRLGWIMWPFEALWWLLTLILEFTGRLITVIIGVVMMMVGAVISITLVGAVLGIPLLFFGVLLTLRGLF
jgi:hypothetical protein